MFSSPRNNPLKRRVAGVSPTIDRAHSITRSSASADDAELA
jgi:hypothetical protein